MALITADARTFLEAPNSTLLATRDGENVPWCGRASAMRCADDGVHVRVWLPAAIAARPEADLRANGQLAVVTVHLVSNRAIQLKGRAVRVGPAPAEDRATLEAAHAEFVTRCEQMGLPRRIVERLDHWPALAIELEVEALYEQTPGPGAGAALSGLAAR